MDLVAEMTVINPFDFFLEPYAEKIPFRYEAWEKRELEPFLEGQPAGPAAAGVPGHHRPDAQRASVEFLVNLNQRLQQEIRYVIRMEPGVQTPEQTLELASGSCRDSGWLLVEVLRHLGLGGAFRFRLPDSAQAGREAAGRAGGPGRRTSPICTPGRRFTCPARAGLALTPPPACSRARGTFRWRRLPSPHSAAPVSGLVSPSKVEFHHEMRVTRIHEDSARHQALHAKSSGSAS